MFMGFYRLCCITANMENVILLFLGAVGFVYDAKLRSVTADVGARLDAKMSQRGSQHAVTPGWQSKFAVVLWLLLIAALIRAGANDGVFAAAGWFALFVLFCVPASVIIPGYHTGHYHDRIPVSYTHLTLPTKA